MKPWSPSRKFNLGAVEEYYIYARSLEGSNMQTRMSKSPVRSINSAGLPQNEQQVLLQIQLLNQVDSYLNAKSNYLQQDLIQKFGDCITSHEVQRKLEKLDQKNQHLQFLMQNKEELLQRIFQFENDQYEDVCYIEEEGQLDLQSLIKGATSEQMSECLYPLIQETPDTQQFVQQCKEINHTNNMCRKCFRDMTSARQQLLDIENQYLPK